MIGFEKEDIMQVLQRAYDETEENRRRALKLYDHMESAMLQNKGDLVVLSQMADRYLEQASRQTEILVKLAAVMQKLKQFGGTTPLKPGETKTTAEINSLLAILDENKITPFSFQKAAKPAEKKDDSVKKDDIELETDL